MFFYSSRFSPLAIPDKNLDNTSFFYLQPFKFLVENVDVFFHDNSILRHGLLQVCQNFLIAFKVFKTKIAKLPTV